MTSDPLTPADTAGLRFHSKLPSACTAVRRSSGPHNPASHLARISRRRCACHDLPQNSLFAERWFPEFDAPTGNLQNREENLHGKSIILIAGIAGVCHVRRGGSDHDRRDGPAAVLTEKISCLMKGPGHGLKALRRAQSEFEGEGQDADRLA
jgi:hypothetical protein